MKIVADEETTALRRLVCARCPLKVGKLLATCRACGCVIKAKTALAKSSCPQGRW